MKINTTDITSHNIRVEAERAGIDHITKIASNGKAGDANVTIYRFGDALVAETNGDPVWEEQLSPGEWSEFLSDAGIDL